MEKLLTLLSLQREAQETKDIGTLSHLIINKTLLLISYKQAVFWEADGAKINLTAVSGNAILDEKSPYAIALKKEIKTLVDQIQNDGNPYLNIALFKPQKNNKDHKDFKNPGALLLFKTQEEGLLGGLWLEREKPFEEAELQVLSELSMSYSIAFALVSLRSFSIGRSIWRSLKKLRILIFLIALSSMFIPVRIGITAPAEIVAQNPFIISAPFEGTLDKVIVSPGDPVDKEQIIAEMDKITLEAKLKSTRQALDIAKANLSRLRRESLFAPEKKIELKKVEADITIKEIELDYAQDMMEQSNIRAQKDGIAIFSDKNALQGKPMRMGEKIMMVADPQKSELLIRVPVDAMVPIKADAEVKLFLNVAPLKGYNAKIKSIGYQASEDPDGLLTYKIRALLDNTTDDVRIGWKGTGKIYGEPVFLGYALARRPFVTIRELLGV